MSLVPSDASFPSVRLVIINDNFTKKTIAAKVITTFLDLIVLSLNNFIFNSKNLVCTMGPICAPTYANILMNHFEWKYIYPLTEEKSLTYFRYIDYIFLNQTGTKIELDQFFKNLYKKHPSTKFVYKVLRDGTVFLDTEIYPHNSKLHTKIYRRETDR